MRKMLLWAVAGAAFLASCAQALAFGAVMCFPDSAVGPQGPRTVYNFSVAGSTQVGQSAANPYVLNTQGCSYIYATDIAWAQSIGATYGAPTGVITYGPTGVQTGTTSIQIGTLPANTYIVSIAFTNVTANAVTGGISVSSATAGGGTVMLTAGAVAASTSVSYPPTIAALPSVAPTAAPYNNPGTPLFIQAVTAWNNANVLVTIQYSYY